MRRIATIATVATLALGLLVAAQPATAATKYDLVLKQDKPVILEQKSADGVVVVRIINAVLRDTAGKPAGVLRSRQETITVPTEGQTEETRLRTLVFDLKKGQIIAQGASTYPIGGSHLAPADEVSIPIIGGTGAYRGVRGELVTKHEADDSYTQKFIFTR